jgi:IS605 OrfB family transposase
MELDSVKSVSLKLDLNAEQMIKFERHFKEFSKGVNKAIELIYRIKEEQKEQKAEYKRIPKEEIKEAICSECKKKKELVFSKGKKKICGKCYGRVFGSNAIRKQIYPTKNRKIEDNTKCVKNYARLTKTEFSAAHYVANSQIRGLTQQRRKLKYNIWRKKKQLEDWIELRDNESKRVEKPLEKHERVKKFCHIKNKDSKWERYYSLREIEKRISRLEKSIEKLEKRNLSKPHFKGNSVMLWKNCCDLSNVKNGTFKIKIYKDWFDFPVLGEHQKDVLSNCLVLDKYSYIYRKDGEYYLNFPVYKKVELPEPTDQFSVLSIDRGINKMVVYLELHGKNSKPSNVHFESGGKINFEKFKYQKLRTKMFGKKHGYKKSRKFGNIVLRLSDYIAHNISRQIVDQIKGKKDFAIVLEDLEGIKSEKKAATGKAALTKKIRYKLSLGSYRKIQSYLVYKALEEEIPVVLVEAKGTSAKCNKCGKQGHRPRQEQFICPYCGYKANADFNGAVNIGKKFYEEIRAKALTFDEKQKVFKFQTK